MPLEFQLPERGSAKPAAQTLGAAYSRTALDIRGSFNIQGPQQVGPNGVPQEVADLFERMPNAKHIAITSSEGGVVFTHHDRPSIPEKEPFFTKEEVQGYFATARIEVIHMWEITNQYWRNNQTRGPWWLVQVPAGLLEIGWRKNVISIDWSGCQKVRCVVTEDDVTKEDYLVHAWSVPKVIEYLCALAPMLIKT